MRRKGGCHRGGLWKSAELNPSAFAFVVSHPFAKTAKGWATRPRSSRNHAERGRDSPFVALPTRWATSA